MVRRFARSAGFFPLFELETTRRGGEGSPQDEYYKVARASGGVRMRRAPRTPAVPLHAPDPHYWDRTPAQGLLPPPDAVDGIGTNNELHVHPVVDLVVRAAVVRLVVLRFFPGRYSGNIVAPVGVARRRVVVARPF